MPHLRTLVTLPLAAATALLVAAQPAAAAPVASTVPTAQAAAAATAVKVTPSPVLDLYLKGGCPGTTLKSVVAMQRVDWIWAPIVLDNADGTPLPKILLPNTMLIAGEGLRARHDFVPGVLYSAPGPKPESPTTCTLDGSTADGTFTITVTGTVVTLPKWLDAVLPPIKPPRKG